MQNARVKYKRPYCKTCKTIWGVGSVGRVFQCPVGHSLVLKSFNPWIRIFYAIGFIAAAIGTMAIPHMPVIWIGGIIYAPFYVYNGFKQWSAIKKLDAGVRVTTGSKLADTVRMFLNTIRQVSKDATKGVFSMMRPSKVVEGRVVKDVLIKCDHCGQKNRIYEKRDKGIYRCGACRAIIRNPFLLRRRLLKVGFLLGLIIIGLVIASAFKWIGAKKQVETTSWRPPVLPQKVPPAKLPTPFPEIKWSAAVQPSKPAAVEEYPAMNRPPNGETYTFTSRQQIAPFEVRTSGGSDYLVKLVEASSGQPMVTCFIRGGESISLEVPLGEFVLKYASGKTWYGYEHLFGGHTTYTKADTLFRFETIGNQIRGHTVTLYKVSNGNLETQRISASEF